MAATRMPENQIRQRLASFGYEHAAAVKLHNRGARRRWTKLVLKTERRRWLFVVRRQSKAAKAKRVAPTTLHSVTDLVVDIESAIE